MNVTAPEHPSGRPIGEAALDVLDTLARFDGCATTGGIVLDTGRTRQEVTWTLCNLRRQGRVQRLDGVLWEITREGRLVLCGGER